MRRWIKLWTQESLRGTIRFDFTPAERSVWYDLLILAGDCRLEGIIAAGDGVPYPHMWISSTLNISPALLERVLVKCKSTGRITENDKGIHIINWTRYQSEYDRQKKYRQSRAEVDDPVKYKGQRYDHMVRRT